MTSGDVRTPETDLKRYDFATVDVFTDYRFGGNPLAVFPQAEGLTDGQMQSLAAEMNLSETTFVLPPNDPANTARVRIFNRREEMPFAGHPNVGTACVLASLGLATGDTLVFEELAGEVVVQLLGGADGRMVGATIDAPQPLSLHGELGARDVADCLGLFPADILVAHHQPVIASVGIEFVLVEASAEAVARATPRLDAFRRVQADMGNGVGRLSVLVYARTAERIHARMFAPLSGTWEDPATGSANAALAALLLSIEGGDRMSFDARQGIELGRPSRLITGAWRDGDAIRASVGGACVPMFHGYVEL